ncbi:hypothetical protein FJY71_05070, partial [candidate division WOR-3 bacterium]|nr:hypothetical protein [candidate division WOR-3 bacterium]
MLRSPKGGPVKVTKVYRDYYLTEWTNPERRSAVGIICTIGPSVFSDYEQRTKATISELVEGGMDIARINLSHYPLLNGEANPELVKELVHIVKEIRAASASHRRPVNIMFDTQGPEFRVSALRVRKWDQLVAAVELKIEPRTRFTIADCDLKDLPFTTGCAALILENQELPAPQPGATCTLHIGSTTAALRAEKTAFGLQYVVTSPVKAKVRLPNGALPRLEWSGRGPLPLDIKGIRTAVLNLANMQENAVLYLASEKEADKLPTGLDEAVVFVEYEGNLCDDAGCRDTGYPIYASNGKVGFTYEGLLESRNEEAVAVKMRKSYGESLKVRMSMNLFENARYSARDCVFSASDRAYLGKLLCEDHGFTECPVDSIALSFTRHAGDLKQAYAELRAMGPKHPVSSIKLVAKIESPHCFWQYDEDRKTFNLDAERTYEGYKQILCE